MHVVVLVLACGCGHACTSQDKTFHILQQRMQRGPNSTADAALHPYTNKLVCVLSSSMPHMPAGKENQYSVNGVTTTSQRKTSAPAANGGNPFMRRTATPAPKINPASFYGVSPYNNSPYDNEQEVLIMVRQLCFVHVWFTTQDILPG